MKWWTSRSFLIYIFIIWKVTAADNNCPLGWGMTSPPGTGPSMTLWHSLRPFPYAMQDVSKLRGAVDQCDKRFYTIVSPRNSSWAYPRTRKTSDIAIAVFFLMARRVLRFFSRLKICWFFMGFPIFDSASDNKYYGVTTN